MVGGLSRSIEYDYCQKILTADDIRYNEQALKFNAELSQVRDKSMEIVSSFKHIIAPYKPYASWELKFESPRSFIVPYYSWLDWFKIQAPFLITSSFYCLLLSPAWAFGLWVWNKFVLWIVFDVCSLSVFGALGGASAIFFGLACGKSVMDVRRAERALVSLEGISDVIQQCNDGKIIIE